ncbi:hypothetical protein ILUMI_13188 [Ignelater luminosus]|uniref:Uncharacterized protein n=1 Tax=Ignelater luminosus TaxID=2038154 RepID=A0A8K0CUY9_IGNLU|nr:hypothetical protein ILUMI_13188 [Ignelater luminosus]
MVFLGLGALLFVVLGSLEFAALDSVPPDLVDNAAVIGSLSLITAALFLIDLGGPKAKKEVSEPAKSHRKVVSKPLESSNNKPPETYAVESEIERLERKEIEALEEHSKKLKSSKDQRNGQNGFAPKITGQNGFKSAAQNGYKKMKDKETPKRFDIYGKDADEFELQKGDVEHEDSKQAERHSPVWSQIRKGQYGKYDVVVPSYLYPKTDSSGDHQEGHPSGPGDPGYVQYTAQRWGQSSQKTPRHSPTQHAGA